MGLTTAVYTGLSGLNANSTRIDTIGNNLANVNTTAFKGSRTLFQTQFYDTLSAGTSPNTETGGTNPHQIGRGVTVATTQQNFNAGPVQTTGIASDLALEGDGFFILETGEGEQRFTRDGAFTLDAENNLVSVDGYRVLGYGADSEGNVDQTLLGGVNIPIGSQSIARATTSVNLEGDLSALGTIATQSSVSTSQRMVTGGAANATDATALTDLRSFNDPGVALFQAGDILTFQNISKGDRDLPPAEFIVGETGATLGDLAAWLEDTLGIQAPAGAPGTGGVSIVDGALVIQSDAGVQNSINVQSVDVANSNDAQPQPLTFTQTASATGASTLTGFTVYDSLGTPVNVQVTFVLEEKAAAGPVWRFYAESADTGNGARALGTGLVAFDNLGNVRSVEGDQITLDRTGSGAGSPMTFQLDFSRIHGLSTQSSGVILNEQDGYPPGELTGYQVQADGMIEGTYSNGLKRTLGQIPVARVANAEGMIAEADNLFTIGPNAGGLTIATAGEFGTGPIRGGALELSNVDIGEEFIGLVTASTGFQASSRVITVSSDMLNQLLLIVR